MVYYTWCISSFRKTDKKEKPAHLHKHTTPERWYGVLNAVLFIKKNDPYYTAGDRGGGGHDSGHELERGPGLIDMVVRRREKKNIPELAYN